MRSTILRPLLALTSALLLLGLILSLLTFNADPAPVRAAGGTPSVYLPLVMRTFPPLETVFGVEMQNIAPAGGLAEVSAAGASWVRLNGVLWSDVEPTEGARLWDAPSLVSVRQQLSNAAGRGLRVVLVVRSTPGWAQDVLIMKKCGPIHVEEYGAFALFVKDLVTHLRPYGVKYWEIWNEPDAPSTLDGDSPFGCWGDPGDATYFGGDDYGAMLAQVYPRVKEADPTALVLVGGLLLDCDPAGTCPPDKMLASTFLPGVLQTGGGGSFDGVSFHAYDYFQDALGRYSNDNWSSGWNTTGPALSAKAQFLRTTLANAGVSGKFLMNTELAVLCGGPGDLPGGTGCEATPDSPYELTKAYYLAQTYSAAAAEGLRANVWFSVFGWRNSALLNADLSPRPAYTAFAVARDEIRNATYLGPVAEGDLGGALGVKGYKFDRGDRRVWVLWSLDGADHNVTLSVSPLVGRTALGSYLPSLVMPITVGLEPLYVELP